MRDRYLHDDDLLEEWERMRRLTKPLLRFLRRQVGRRWAEIQPALDARYRALPVERAVRTQVRKAVEGLVFGRRAIWCRMRGEFFVASDSGLLCYRATKASKA
jgi:hypothetical protein